MFAYARDPLFIACWFLYAANRLFLKPALPPGEIFFRGYFNDLLVVPCALPLLLLLHRKLSLRHSDLPPSAFEIGLHLSVWSVIFEVAGPLILRHATPDAFDVLAYAAGGAVSWLIWRLSYREVAHSRRVPLTSAGWPWQ